MPENKAKKAEKKVELKAHVYPKTEAQRLPEVKPAKKVGDRQKNVKLAIALLKTEGIISVSDAEALAKKVRVAVKK